MGNQIQGYVITVKMAETPAKYALHLCGIMAFRPAGVWIRTEAGAGTQREDGL